MRKWIKDLSLLVGGFLIPFLICEGIVRILGVGGKTTITYRMYHKFNPDTGWVGLPDAEWELHLPRSSTVQVKTNSRGLRDSEKDLQKTEGIRRIIVLGDSYMWGWGVENEEMFSKVLQEVIPATETVNLGVRGYGTVQELVRLETEGLLYAPDLTLLGFFKDDLQDNFDDREGARPVAEVEDGVLRIANRPVEKPKRSPVILWFDDHSRFLAFCRYYVNLVTFKMRERRQTEVLRKELSASDASSPPKRNVKTRKGFAAAEPYALHSPEMDIAWNAMRLLLSRMKGSATKEGGSFIVVYCTPRTEVDRKAFDNMIRRGGFDPELSEFDWDHPSNRLGELCASLEIPYVNPNADFRNHPDPASLFLSGNNHWSAAGNRLAAQTVAAKIENIEW